MKQPLPSCLPRSGSAKSQSGTLGRAAGNDKRDVRIVSTNRDSVDYTVQKTSGNATCLYLLLPHQFTSSAQVP